MADNKEVENIDELDEVSIPELLLYGGVYLTFFDILMQLGRWLKIKPLAQLANQYDPIEGIEDEEPFVPEARQIPFGPYMVLGALLAVFIGDRIVEWYITFAHLRPPAG